MQPVRFLAPVVAVVLFSGCASTFAMRSVARGEPVGLSTERGLAFGRLVLLENGKETLPYRGWPHRVRPPVVELIHRESGRKAFMPVEKDGHFYWSLPKGTYRVNELRVACDYLVRPPLTFEVPRRVDIAYLGTLKADVEVAGIAFMKAWWIQDVRRLEVLDESATAADILRGHNPTIVLERMERSLLRRIPGEPVTTRNLTHLFCEFQ